MSPAAIERLQSTVDHLYRLMNDESRPSILNRLAQAPHPEKPARPGTSLTCAPGRVSTSDD